MATQFDIDCALMAGVAYRSTREERNRFPIPEGWTEVALSHVNMPSGFEAVCFQRGDEIVISYAGTYDKSLGDLAADLALGVFGVPSTQLYEAAEYYLQVKAANASNPDAHITLTGHSLGGGLASLIAVFFNEKATTFDQAPFRNSASWITATELRSYLTLNFPASTYPQISDWLAPLDRFILSFDPLGLGWSQDGLDAREAKVTNLSVQGEFLSVANTLRIGSELPPLTHGDYFGPFDLHTQSLLTAFVQNDQFRQVTSKLTDLLGMIFDKNLYFRDPNKLTNPEVNLLEHLIRHQEGFDPAVPNDGDHMLDRFTSDLWKIAQDGGLTMADKNLTDALIAFAMQAYYFNRPASNATLFDTETGGIHFDRMDVADTLDGDTGAKGYTMYFTNYLATLPANDRAVIVAQLPDLLDWYIQAGSQAMTATAGTQRAFMLGGSGNDTLTGGSQADLLVGNSGVDTLSGGGGNDTLCGGNGADTLNGGAGADLMIGGEGVDTYYLDGNDTIRDTGSNFIVYQGQVIAGAFVQEGMSNTYSFLGDNNFTLIFDSAVHLTVSGTDSITFEQQTSAADFENGAFGITLYDSVDAALTFDGTAANNTMAVSVDSNGQPEYLYFSKYDHDPYPQYVSYYSYFSQNFHIEGNEGNDILCGLAGQDYISGGVGSDRIIGDGWVDGVDWTNQGAGDILYGNAGMDFIQGGWGDDLISGGDDRDFLLGYSDNDTVAGDGGDDLALGGTGNDQLSGGAGNDILYGDGYIWGFGESMGDIPLPSTMSFQMTYGTEGFPIDYSFAYQLGNASVEYGDDLLTGGDGNDWLNGGGGDDTLLGEAGHDTLVGDDGDDFLDGGDGNDKLLGGLGTDQLNGGSGNDLLGGQEGNDTLSGGAGTDQLQGNLGNDALDGGAGNDVLFGDAGNDTINGGAGDDYLDGGDGDDIYSFGRGAGHDTVFDRGSVSGDTVRFTNGVLPDDIALVRYQDHLILSLNGGSDTLTLANWFTSDATKVEHFEFADGSVWGVSAINNHLPSWTQSGGGSGGSNPPIEIDSSGASATVGGRSIELPVSFTGTWDLMTLNAYWQYWQGQQLAGTSSSGTLNKMIQGSTYNDYLYGGDGNDTLYGEEGNDYLVGSKGNDVLQGGPGIDIMLGGAGDDKYWVDDPNDVVIEYTVSDWDWVYASCDYTLSTNLELLILQGNAREGRGNNQDNAIEANDLGNTLFGYGGNDNLCGGIGDDALYGGDGDDDLYGWRGNDLLDGGNGDDFLRDSYGNSIMRGGAGNDHLVYENGDGWEVNVLEGGDGNDILEAYVGSNTLVGGTGDDKLRCWSQYGNNRYLFNRGDGHDTIDMAGYWLSFGSNTLVFAAGITPQDIECSWNRVVTYRFISVGPREDDGYYVIAGISENLELTIKDTGDRVTVYSWFNNQRAHQLQIQFADGTVWDAAWLHQNTSITGTDQDDRYFGRDNGDFSLNGSAYNDVLDGRGGDDELFGFGGNDTLSGGTGNDYLYGDMGDDILDGGAGNDELCDDDGNDVFVFGRGYGQDIVYSWDENLSFTDVVRFQPDVAPTDIVVSRAADGSYDLVLSIRGTDDILTISGFFDPDYGQNMQIDGVEFSDGTVWNAEHLTALASGAADDVVITGTSGADTLTGTTGNDTLQGGAGNDLLSGGDGNDIYLFNPSDGVDRITDSSGTDTIRFGAGISPDSLSLGLGSLLVRVGDQGEAIHLEDFNPDDPFNFSVIENFEFGDGTVLGIGDLLARGFDIQGSTGNDLLTGTAITDRITGGEGADILIGGKGDDLLAGGTGNDTYLFNLGDGQETIADISNAAEGNFIAFGAGIALSDLVFARDGGDLLIRVDSQDDTVRLKDFDRFGNNGSLVADTLQFADGSQASLFALTNTAPVVGVMVENQTAFEDATYSFTIPADTFVDADAGDSLTYSATLGDSNALPPWLAFDPATCTFSGTPTNADVGILDVTVSATDTAGAAAVVGFALNITNVNDAPVVVGDSAFLIEDLAVSANGNVLANDSDVDSGTILAVADPAIQVGSYGTLSLTADGSYAYTLDNASGAVQSLGRGAMVAEHFSYTATDGIANAAAALDITLAGSNDAPILAAPLADQQVNFNKGFSWQLPVGSFVDPDQGDTLDYSATLADGSPLPTWLAFDAATQTFSGRAPKQVGEVEVKVTATDKVAATGSTGGSLSASDLFRITISHGNEGVGNGEDAPPSGHDGNCNDGPGTGPGTPGRRRDHDDHRSSDKKGDRPDDWDNDGAWGQSQRMQPAYLNASPWDDKQSSTTMKSGEQMVDPSVAFGCWLTMDLAVSTALAEKKTLSWLDERLGADTTALNRASTGFSGSTTPCGADLFSLQAGHGQELTGFNGLGDGLWKVA